jgi:hypothetical protein
MVRIFPYLLIGLVGHVLTPLDVMGMEEFMRLMSQWLLKKDLIYF